MVEEAHENKSQKQPSPVNHYIVGIGASAGGLEAVRAVLANLPKELNASYIILQHLDSTHLSQLVELLEDYSPFPVKNISEKTLVEPYTVYVTPANYDLSYTGGYLQLIESPPNGPKPSIDYFLSSLAMGKQYCAVGMILSGAGRDGTHGVRAIKANNGITIAQTPETAKFDSMPSSAIASGNVDLVLAPEEIGEGLKNALQHHSVISEKVETGFHIHELKKIIDLLYQETGVDLSGYKPTTLFRRISLRASLYGRQTLEDYVEFARHNPKELQSLLRSILISVTGFFRDDEAFMKLREAIESQLKNNPKKDLFRVWIPACSTGEEAYSIAMLLDDIRESGDFKFQLQIFATDIDEESILHARKGEYPLATVMEGKTTRSYMHYFTFDENTVIVKKSIRDRIVLAKHDLLKDTPFLHLDLISCRNLLIYLENESQDHVLSLFHYCLAPEGFLFLGKSESVTKKNDLFTSVDSTHKIFSRKNIQTQKVPAILQKFSSPKPPQVLHLHKQEKTELFKEREFASSLLQLLDCSAVLTDEKGSILYIRGDVTPYLRFQDGSIRETLNAISMARKEIRFILQALLNKARKDNRPVVGQGVKIVENRETWLIEIKIGPVLSGQDQNYLIVFERSPGPAITEPLPSGPVSADVTESLRVRELEDELAITREHLQDMVEELETNGEELQSLNEELQSANEELQASNEELGTSNEELQASNEELQTLNEELRNKSEQLQATLKELEDSERRYRELVENAKSVIIRWKTDGAITFFNEFAQQFFGYRQEEILGRNVGLLLPDKDSDGLDLSHLVHDLLEAPEKYENFVNENVCRDGSRVWMKWTNRVIVDAESGSSEILAVGTDITELKLAEIRLKQKRKDLRFAQKIAKLGSWRIDLQTNEVIWTEELYNMYGFDPSLPPPPYEEHKKLFTPESWEILSDSLAHTIETGEPYDLELETVKDEQKHGWMWVRGEAEKDGAGKITGLWGAAQDISDYKEKEVQIQVLAEHRQLALDAAKLGWWQYNPGTGISTWDKRYREIFEIEGFSQKNDVILNEYIHPEDRAELWRTVEDSLSAKENTLFSAQYRVTPPTGGLKWVEAHGITSFKNGEDPAGSVTMVGTVEDISIRKRTELALKSSEMRTRLFIEHAPAALAMFDSEMRYLSCSKRWLEDYNIDLPEITGKSHYEIFPEITDEWKRIHQLAMQGERQASMSDEFKRQDGSVQYLNWEIIPWKQQSGEVGGIVIFSEDITDIVNAEKEREFLKSQLTQAQKMESIGRLAGGVAHDYNNMLNVIFGYVDLAFEKISEEDEIYEDLKEISRAARRSAEVTRQLLTFARKQTIEPQVVDVNESISTMLKMLQRLIGENIKLVWAPSDDVWTIHIEPGQVNQILANLCVNAQAAISGNGNIHISTSNVVITDNDSAILDTPGDYVQIQVSDDGCGMDAETLGKIFDPFFTTKDVGEGTGLGLSTVYGIVQQNKGGIRASSIPGKGATFTILFPRFKDFVKEDGSQKKSADDTKGNETILIVEDEPAIIQVTTKMLQSLGYHVISTSNPGEAAALALESGQKVDLLITDVIMPTMNGRELAEQLTGENPHMKVLFMSGYPDDVIAEHGIVQEGITFLQKPFTRKELSEKIRKALINTKRIV